VSLTDGTNITVKASGDCTLQYGDTVQLTAPADKLFYFDQAGQNVSEQVNSQHHADVL
jgi:multiple sugar transport system ATP-binding protein